MTTTERPVPPITRCPSWCQDPMGSEHPWVQEPGQPWNNWTRSHTYGGPAVELRVHEVDEDPSAARRAFVEFVEVDEFDLDTAAQLSLDAAAAVAVAVTDPVTCAEDTPAIQRVVAERAVLDAVRAWADGDGKTLAIENAYSLLAALADER